MKNCLIILWVVLVPLLLRAQQNYADSLKRELIAAKRDTNKVKLYAELADTYKWDYPDSAFKYGFPGLQLAKESDFLSGEANIVFSLCEAFATKNNYPKALQLALKFSLSTEKSGDLRLKRIATISVANVYFYSGQYQKALDWYRKLHPIMLSLFPKSAGAAAFLGETFFEMDQLDSARYYLKKVFENARQRKQPLTFPPAYFYSGKIYLKTGQYDTALRYYREGIAFSTVNRALIEGHLGIAYVFEKLNTDSAIHHAKLALMLSQETGIVAKLSEASKLTARLFLSSKRPDSAIKYFQLGIASGDSLYSIAGQNLSFNEQLSQQELAYEQQKAKNRIRVNSFFGALGTFLLILFFFWRNNRQKQKAKVKIEKAYTELKNTQTQLIQSEKMASLGELTAGIAHEIQNPLNFVNNFSDVNTELVEELKLELTAGNTQSAIEVANNIKDNEQKISYHGKRADAIVKSMLQHSRSSSGKKEPTDINALADEYLRLSYHGLRAKDKSFNAKFETHLDSSIEKINVAPQEMGRVILNLINNAFYAVAERRKKNEADYEPSVTVTTKNENGKIEVRVKDNGTGISQKVLEKIFQPFFTTKPTGQGTGLGLSLAYDIITKGHGGELRVETKEGEGAEFIIQLPNT